MRKMLLLIPLLKGRATEKQDTSSRIKEKIIIYDDACSRGIAMIISQYIGISNHYVVYLKLICICSLLVMSQFKNSDVGYDNYISVK